MLFRSHDQAAAVNEGSLVSSVSSDFWPDEDRTRLSQFTFFNGSGRSIVRRRSALLLFASSGSCHDRVAIDAGVETQPYEKRAAIADGHCINSQQKHPHQQAESTEVAKEARRPRMSEVYASLGCSAQCGRCAHSIKRIMDERPTCASGCAHAHASMH